MTAMEEDARKTDQDTAGSIPPAEPAAQKSSGSVPPKLAGDNVQSPFLGKLVPEKPTVPLAGSALDKDAELQKTIAELTARKERSSAPPASTSETQTGNLKAADLVHGGNVISLLQEEAQKELGVEQLTETRLAQEETPIERNIREIGLEPRRFPGGAPGQSVLEKKQEGLPNIRTYASDMSEEIRKRGETLASIVGAEKIKDRKTVDPETEKTNQREQRVQTLALLGGAGALVLVGIGAVTAVVLFMYRPAALPARPDIIPANTSEEISVDSKSNLANILAQSREASQLNLGEVEELVITENGVRLLPADILLRLGAPEALARNALDIMVGVHAYNRTQPFILVRVSAYDVSFQGMLGWEKTLGDGLGKFFAPGSGSPPGLLFSDRVFQNVDLRESQPEWHIEYAFPERNLLLITTNDSTLKEVLTRLRLQSGN